MVDLEQENHLDPTVRSLWLFAGLIPYVLLVLPFGFFAPSWGAGAIVFVFFAALFAALIVWYIFARWRNWTFQATDDSFVIKKGVIWKRRVELPYFRIQQIDIIRGPIFRMFSLSSTLVSTASRQADPVISGMNREVAEQLRGYLLGRAGITDAV